MLAMVDFIFGKEINTGDGLISVYTSSLISYQRSRLQYFTPWAYVAENPLHYLEKKTIAFLEKY
jgi:hypothetical protein